MEPTQKQLLLKTKQVSRLSLEGDALTTIRLMMKDLQSLRKDEINNFYEKKVINI